MLDVCRASVPRGIRHFLYGGKEGTAQELSHCLQARFPGLKIVGCYEPPFRPLNSREEAELAGQVAAARPDILWVGLSTPSQERFMAEYLPRLDVTLMLGVGAAFDIHTGRAKQAPRWVQKAGFQWLFRLCHEPRRLWRRNLRNFRFIPLAAAQWCGLRKY
jgi:N-acetylglucosaminyldiphosphoundecaprenol N-acetyl-beta-D-mannosaminyltransferase